MRRFALPVAILIALASAASAAASPVFVFRGHGWGHGVGLSQYGALGRANDGRDYKQILGFYYDGTNVGTTSQSKIRVLLTQGLSSLTLRSSEDFKVGDKTLTRLTDWKVVPTSDGEVRVVGKGKFGDPATARPGKGFLQIDGARYRGDLKIYNKGGKLAVVNVVALQGYLYSVVPREMPSSWPLEALKAQAVAARTYALATRKHGGVFDLYPDTRSQVYKGVAGETRASNAAVRATRQEVVTFGGSPIVTYYFSTSGGETENIENSFLGADPQPYLEGVGDPYDGISPRHTWRISFSTRQMDSRLGSYSRGRFRKIKVLARGVSPRIVRARVYGTGGTRTITGPTLRARLGLYDTWARFTTVSTSQVRYRAAFAALFGRRLLPLTLNGAFTPAPRGRRLVLERRRHGRWRRVRGLRTGAGGRYAVNVRRRGLYRVRAGSVAGPAVRVS